MRYYPLFLDLQGQHCCVVGGGAVAERKIRVLLRCGADVTVVSPAVDRGIRRLIRSGKLKWIRSSYSSGVLRGVFLAVSATDERPVNSRVSSDCRKRGILINVVDVPGESNFIVPSVIEKGGLIVAISTGGKAPCLAKKIRQDLTAKFLPRYAGLLKGLAGERRRLKRVCAGQLARKSALKKIIDSRL